MSIGDTIGIVAPASPFEQVRLEQGIDLIRQMGFKVKVPEDLMVPAGYLANTDAVRANHINRYFSDNNIRAIACARGGYGAGRILPLIDYDIIRENPKFSLVFLILHFY